MFTYQFRYICFGNIDFYAGDFAAETAGGDFTPHLFTVHTGEVILDGFERIYWVISYYSFLLGILSILLMVH